MPSQVWAISLEKTHCWPASWLAKDALESSPRSPLEVKQVLVPVTSSQEYLGRDHHLQAHVRRLVRSISQPLLLFVSRWVLVPKKLPCQDLVPSNDERLSLLQYSETRKRVSRRLCLVVEGGAGLQPLWVGMSASCAALGGLLSPLTLSFSIYKVGILNAPTLLGWRSVRWYV